MSRKTVSLLIIGLLLISCRRLHCRRGRSAPESPVTIYYGGPILTMATDTPQYVEVVAFRDDRIVFAGSREASLGISGAKQVRIDLAGKSIVPGFIRAFDSAAAAGQDIAAAQQALASAGYTTSSEAGVTPARLGELRGAAQSGKLLLDLAAFPGASPAMPPASGYDGHLRIAGPVLVPGGLDEAATDRLVDSSVCNRAQLMMIAKSPADVSYFVARIRRTNHIFGICDRRPLVVYAGKVFPRQLDTLRDEGIVLYPYGFRVPCCQATYAHLASSLPDPAKPPKGYEALRLKTDFAARSLHEEVDKGSIAEGKLADLVILSADPLTDPEAAVLQTIKGGRTIYARNKP